MTISVGSSALLDREQPLDHLVLFRAGLARVDLDHLVLVAPLEERVGLDQLQQLARVRGVARDDQQERFDDAVAGLAGVGFQLDLHALVQPDAVFQFQPLDLLRRHAAGLKFLRVTTAGSFTKPSAIASRQRIVDRSRS